MKDNTVTVDNTVSPAIISFSDNFNVAVPFIDRHLSEGQAKKVAIQTSDGSTITYSALNEHVNRAGNALLSLGLNQGDRLLMVIKDAPEFFYIFWGAIKCGIIPVPLNTLLRAKDYSFMIEDSRAKGIIYSP
ncbi:MAG: AMP-binding protein, partial [Pseudomonadota bacterium]|nr:AMP-binding protein [Pseudomonadota bacterium]